MIRQFGKKLFILLSLAFILATIIGTISHEFGHYIAAKSLGYKASINYARTYINDNELSDSINAIRRQYIRQIMEGTPFPGKETYERLNHKYSNDELWIIIAGPLQTLLTGTIGLVLLFVWRRSFKERQELKVGQWTLIFITLFWLRQTANLVVWLGDYLLTKHFSRSGDEIRIARKLGLPFWSLATITGVTGLIILCVVIFKFIPKQQRQTFILSGIIGGGVGYILWLYLLGPVLIP